MASSVSFLDYQVSTASIRPLQGQVEVVQQFPCPLTINELKAFLGKINYYWSFLPGLSHTLHPLTYALNGGPRGGYKGSEIDGAYGGGLYNRQASAV